LVQIIMGPFELADHKRLDLGLEIIENLNISFGVDRFKPSITLKNLEKEWHYGRKIGRGFYEY